MTGEIIGDIAEWLTREKLLSVNMSEARADLLLIDKLVFPLILDHVKSGHWKFIIHISTYIVSGITMYFFNCMSTWIDISKIIYWDCKRLQSSPARMKLTLEESIRRLGRSSWVIRYCKINSFDALQRCVFWQKGKCIVGWIASGCKHRRNTGRILRD